MSTCEIIGFKNISPDAPLVAYGDAIVSYENTLINPVTKTITGKEDLSKLIITKAMITCTPIKILKKELENPLVVCAFRENTLGGTALSEAAFSENHNNVIAFMVTTVDTNGGPYEFKHLVFKNKKKFIQFATAASEILFEIISFFIQHNEEISLDTLFLLTSYGRALDPFRPEMLAVRAYILGASNSTNYAFRSQAVGTDDKQIFDNTIEYLRHNKLKLRIPKG